MAIDNALRAVDELLVSIANSPVSILADASRHILSAGGKRLRPRLVLLAYQAVGGQDLERAVPLAAAVEVIHTATLVHDDINDHGTLRRGRETVNARWGRTFALLTGDFMFTKAYELMLGYSGDYNAILAHAAVELVEGETLQIYASQQNAFDPEIYLEIITKKTAALFMAATQLGAQLAEAPQDWIDALRKYALNLGLAFQITDDVLDLAANSQQIGKNAGIDVAQGRGIAVALAGHFGQSSENGNGNHVALQEAVVHEAITRGRAKAAEYGALASSSLDILPPSAAVDELRLLARQVVERDH